MANLNIQDNSGDKEFFTIIPNYIANHSTANDQALYFQMKKHAGEEGKCFATEKTLMKKLGIGKKAYDKSIAYLLEKGWITYVGLSGGKTRPIKTYKVNNIWKLNSDYYKKISAESTLSQDISQKEGDKSQKQHKISAESNVEEDPVLIRSTNNTAEPSSAGQTINLFIERFQPVNPSYEKLFANKTQRSAMQRLLERWGAEKLGRIIDYLPTTNAKPYSPTITTPLQLEDKMGQLMAFVQKEKQSKNNVTVI